MSEKLKRRIKAGLLAFTEWFQEVATAIATKIGHNWVVVAIMGLVGTGFGAVKLE